MHFESIAIEPFQRDDLAFHDERYKGSFIVTIERNINIRSGMSTFDVWLRHADYGIATMLYGLPCEDFRFGRHQNFWSITELSHIICSSLDQEFELYANEYLDECYFLR